MFLFDDCMIPADDNRAMEILHRISKIWEDNACTKTAYGMKGFSPELHYPHVSLGKKEALIQLSVTSPHILEEKLGEEASLFNILRLVAEG